jgi:hypothetical protein
MEVVVNLHLFDGTEQNFKKRLRVKKLQLPMEK